MSNVDNLNDRGDRPLRHGPPATSSFGAWLGRIKRWQIAVCLAGVGFALVLPSLGTGLAALDDFEQQRFVQAKLEHQGSAAERPWYDVYNLANGNAAQAIVATKQWARPWWAFDELKIRFLRPVAAALLFVDYGLFHDHLWLAHLHSALWYFLACALVTALILQLSTDREIAVLGALLFVMDDAHANPASWLAGRNAIVALAFICLALLLYDAACRLERRALTAWAALAVLLALLSAENVLSALPMFGAYALFLDRRSLARRVLSIAPILLVVVGWYAARKALGFGMYGSGAYLDPLRDASAYWNALPERYFRLLRLQFSEPFFQWSAVPLSLIIALDYFNVWIILPALVVFVVRHIDRSRELAFWVVSAVLGILPLTAAAPHPRLLTHVGIALWMVLAHFVMAAGRYAASLNGAKRPLLLAALALALSTHLVLAPLAFIAEARPHVPTDAVVQTIADDPNCARRQLVIINVPDSLRPLGMIQAHVRKHLPRPLRLAVLGATVYEVEVTRLDDHRFELYTPPGYLLDEFANFWRGPSAPMSQGYRVQVAEYSALVTRVTPDGRPLRIRFQFDRRLDDPGLRFMYWSAGTLKDFQFPPVHTRWIIPADFDHSMQIPEENLR